jgi:hypothetical protein
VVTAAQEAGEGLRRIPFFLGLALIVLVLLIELGSAGCARSVAGSTSEIETRIFSSDAFKDAMDEIDDAEDEADARRQIREAIREDESPPGYGIPYMALVDGILVFTTLMIGLSLIVAERLHGKLQGVITLIFSFLLILGALILTILAFVLLVFMLSLFFSPPFGTIAYLGLFGFFNVWAAEATLALLMLLKLGYAASLTVAHQRFLENKGLLLMVVTSLVCSIVISFLHGLVPFVMVSITDAVAAILFGIVAIIWGIVLLIGAIIAIVQALLTR